MAASLVWGDEWKPIVFCEIDPFCRQVLAKQWPSVPIIEDVHDEQAIEQITAHANRIDGDSPRHGTGSISQQQESGVFDSGIDLLTGGPPCQPSSCAGLRQGAKDPRFLWPQALRAVEIMQPEWIIFENPTGFLTLNGGLEYENICAHLEGAGYWVEGFVVPASAVGAWHRRDRVWIVAHHEGEPERTGFCQTEQGEKWRGRSGDEVGIDSNVDSWSGNGGTDKQERRPKGGTTTGGIDCNSDFPRLPIREMQSGDLQEEFPAIIRDPWDMHWLQAVEQFCGVVHGVSCGLERHRRLRIKALGNSIVPQVAMNIMAAIKSCMQKG